MLRARIGVRIHRHRTDTQPRTGPLDTAGDLTAVGNQDLVEHAAEPRKLEKGKRKKEKGTAVRGNDEKRWHSLRAQRSNPGIDAEALQYKGTGFALFPFPFSIFLFPAPITANSADVSQGRH
jgi:hypothetical protein